MGHVIAIDGPAGAGKSTIARVVAEKLGYIYIDTGAMYRAIALWAVRTGTPFSDAHKLEQLAVSASIELLPHNRVLLNGEDVTDAIRAPEISALASQVAAIGAVRAALCGEAAPDCRKFERRDGGPRHRLRGFSPGACENISGCGLRPSACAGVPANRLALSTKHLAAQLADRDHRDRNRSESPLLQAADATYLDSTGMTPEEVEDAILKLVRARISNGKT